MAARMTTTARASPEVSRPALATRAGALRATILPGLALAPRCHSARPCDSTTPTLSSGSRRCFSRVVPSAVDTSERSTSSSTEIGNLDRDYCDDFVCTSSPAVEQTVRSVARDLERGVRYTPALFARDTKYSDPFRSFSGPGPYMRQSWVQESVKSPKVTVERLSMLDKATAQIDWRLQGHVGMAPVDISHTTVIEMNLLTGKVLSLKETWDLSRVAAPVSLLVNASRASWSAKQASKDAQEGLGRMADTINSLGSTDEDSGQVYRDPTDPTKFFQQNNNQQYNDMLTFAMIMIAMYAVYQGFATVLKV